MISHSASLTSLGYPCLGIFCSLAFYPLFPSFEAFTPSSLSFLHRYPLDLNHLLGLGGLDLESLSTVTVIILKSSTHLLGVMVQTIDEITPYDPTLLQPPDGLFPPELEPYITGYLRETSSIVLNSEAIFHAPVLQRR
ncbi:chemotaxis protein CheW [Spirulina sp.]|uniref:chemotaxis protein CheW n=1 Tax=Spirulina sp. TaxID=1157 RepID=UPI003F6F93DC